MKRKDENRKEQAILNILLFNFVFVGMMSIANVAYASDIVDFSPLIELVYSVLKAIGIVVAALGVVTFVKGFSSEQPESKVSGGMGIASGILLFNVESIMSMIGLTL